MYNGINMAHSENQFYYESKRESKPCIFISHKYEDMNAAKEIAGYIKDLKINFYLDDNDNGLQKAVKNNDSEKIVQCIETALEYSSHILILVTEKTRESWWVPYETGYAKNAGKNIASLLLKEADEFPDYLEIETKLTGRKSLTEYLKKVKYKKYFLEHSYEYVNESAKASPVESMHKDALLKYIREI